jgi:chromate transport protein ChrA
MRTGTKFAGLLTLWAVMIVTVLFIWLMVNANNSYVNAIWQYIPAILTAILGPVGINLGVNEVRKAFENGDLSFFEAGFFYIHFDFSVLIFYTV